MNFKHNKCRLTNYLKYFLYFKNIYYLLNNKYYSHTLDTIRFIRLWTRMEYRLCKIILSAIKICIENACAPIFRFMKTRRTCTTAQR